MSLITLHGCMFEEKNHILVLFIQYVLFLLKYSLYSLYYLIPFHAFSLLIIEFYLPQWRLLTPPLFWRHTPTLGSRNGFRDVSGLIHARKNEKKINVFFAAFGTKKIELGGPIMEGGFEGGASLALLEKI